ncbi:polysaccharide ABC transporter ATP-binding protein [Aureivirga sp. CE67]|uniref:ABC transporter ATP-binding protein n=1 Tax=Aureivirga sp. CE67 TaxID=1788983 RepID=UPI0018CB2F82|nr:ABC transporter ATP-binding protein [Aureivirga sp. CE67]
MAETILKVENVSKQYRLGTIGTGTISHDLNRWWAKIRGKQDPFLKIGETNDRSSKGNSEYVWALKDINFEVKKGEVLGIIGKNGAGKSTLLKILSQVTSPTTGSIKSRGRIASLLEVGTGFHPEMTGRENIYLNGAILGMTKKEISSKIDEIIAFSGCERYVDTPVKRYSSGMKVRLAFAVAAHLEPDILVVDEVLAVGDAEFQKKAIGKMKDISKQGGRTVLFVSHDMGAIQSLCSRLVVLENGGVGFQGKVQEGINYYLSVKSTFLNLCKSKKGVQVIDFEVRNSKSNIVEVIEVFDPISFNLKLLFENNIPSDLKIEYFINDLFGQPQTTISSWLNSEIITPRENQIELKTNLINGFSLKEGEYSINLRLFTSETIDFEDIYIFNLINTNFTGYKYPLKQQHGRVYTPNNWNIVE